MKFNTRTTDPETSHKAAHRASHSAIQKYDEIITFLKSTNGVPQNNEDIANALEVDQISSISPRVSELLADHVILEAGTKKNSRNISMRAVVLASDKIAEGRS
jgi:hypothetical protein